MSSNCTHCLVWSPLVTCDYLNSNWWKLDTSKDWVSPAALGVVTIGLDTARFLLESAGLWELYHHACQRNPCVAFASLDLGIAGGPVQWSSPRGGGRFRICVTNWRWGLEKCDLSNVLFLVFGWDLRSDFSAGDAGNACPVLSMRLCWSGCFLSP